MERSRPPLNLESRYAEVSAPRARLFWRVSSGLLSLRELRGLRSLEHEATVLHGAEVASSAQSTARLVQFWVLAGLSSAGLTHSTLKVYVVAFWPTAPLSVVSQWVDFPLYTCFLQRAFAMWWIRMLSVASSPLLSPLLGTKTRFSEVGFGRPCPLGQSWPPFFSQAVLLPHWAGI